MLCNYIINLVKKCLFSEKSLLFIPVRNMKIDQNLKNNQKMLLDKIIAGTTSIVDATILHTAPHHDDIVLGYHAYAMKNWQHNRNHVLYVSSGFNGVSDAYIMNFIEAMKDTIIAKIQESSYQQILSQFVQAYHKNNHEQMFECKLMMIAQSIADIFRCHDKHAIKNYIQQLKIDFQLYKIEKKNTLEIIKLKERIREFESDCKWMICQGSLENITHFRSQFYHADKKHYAAAIELDVQRLVDYLMRVKPTIITVALDPCGIGPKNHFVTLQLIVAALARLDDQNIKIIGYRNVWSNFDLEETSIIVPVNECEMYDMQSIFLNCFTTQKNTVFVASDINGNFAEQMQQIYTLQWQQVQKILNKDFIEFQANNLQDIVGAIFLKELTIDELLILTAIHS